MRLDHLLSTEIQGAVRARCRPPAGWSGVGGAAGVEEIGGSRVVWACFWVPGPPPGLRVWRGSPYRVPSVPLVGFAGSGSGRGGGLRTGEWTRARKISFLVYCFFGRTSSCRGFVLCSDRFVIISAKICCPVFAGFVAGGRVVAREGRMVDALADSTDEGRVRLR